MGPYEIDFLAFFVQLLGDWRVIATTVFVFLAWILFRYIGVVFKQPRQREARLKAKSASKAAKPVKPVRARGKAGEAGEEEAEAAE